MIKKKKLIVVLLILMLLIGLIETSSIATYNITRAQLYSLGSFEYLKYKGQAISSTTVFFEEKGIEYPAYPLENEKSGVGNGFTYTVTAERIVSNQKLSNIIMNGYPYQSIEKLGCANQKEAYVATNEAIAFLLYKNETNFENYEGIGDSGNRVLNAMKQIVQNTQKGLNPKINSSLEVKEVTQWEQDAIKAEYMSTTWKLQDKVLFEDYQIEILNPSIDEIKIIDQNNQEKNTFGPDETFKISIPIEKLQENGNIQLNIKTAAKSFPIFYGEPPSSIYNKAYALTAGPYQDVQIKQTIPYLQNETKILLNQKDGKTGKPISGAKYSLLNQEKKIIFSGLVTDENGQIRIDKLLPGLYYLEQTDMKEPYVKYEGLIEIKLQLNEEKTINIQNTPKEEEEKKQEPQKVDKQEQKPDVQKDKTGIVKIDTSETIKKLPGDFKALPKTGM